MAWKTFEKSVRTFLEGLEEIDLRILRARLHAVEVYLDSIDGTRPHCQWNDHPAENPNPEYESPLYFATKQNTHLSRMYYIAGVIALSAERSTFKVDACDADFEIQPGSLARVYVSAHLFVEQATKALCILLIGDRRQVELCPSQLVYGMWTWHTTVVGQLFFEAFGKIVAVTTMH